MNEARLFSLIEEGQYYLKVGELDKSLHCFSKVIRFSQEKFSKRDLLLNAVLGKAMVLKLKDELDNSLKDFEYCLNLAENYRDIAVKLYFEIGEIYLKKNDYLKAKDNFLKCLENIHLISILEKKVEVLKFLIECSIFLGEDNLCIDYAKKGLTYKEDSYFHLAIITGTEDLNLAKKYAEEILEKKNFHDDVLIRYSLAVIFFNMGELYCSLEQINFCLRKESKNISFREFQEKIIDCLSLDSARA